MHALFNGGVSRFIVVTGYLSEEVEAQAKTTAEELGVDLVCIFNPDWHRPNGISVAAARPELHGDRFILSMCDHMFMPDLVEAVFNAPRPGEDDATYLGCDFRLDNPCVDMDDVTRVALNGDAITSIGKGMDEFQAFDCGVFCAHISLIDSILDGNDVDEVGISDGMKRLALNGQAKAVDIGAAFWIDVDDEVAYEKAEKLASKWLR
jgi:choline kinase